MAERPRFPGSPRWIVLSCSLALAGSGLAGTAAAEAFTLRPPVVSSHGVTERNACFRGAEERSGNSVAIYDPAPCRLQKPRPKPLPVHRGGTVRICTPQPAERVKITVRSRGGKRKLSARPVTTGGRRWKFSMPRFKSRTKMRIQVVYADGYTSWSLPIKRHRH